MYATSTNGGPDNTHITALHEAFIQNWSSANFVRFVSACKSIVDEVANAQTSGNGRMEMLACERVFRQAVWLWGESWPEIDGMGQEDELAARRDESSPERLQNNESLNGTAQKAIEADDDGDDDADATLESPYGGTGLGAIADHNRDSIGAARSQILA